MKECRDGKKHAIMFCNLFFLKRLNLISVSSVKDGCKSSQRKLAVGEEKDSERELELT